MKSRFYVIVGFLVCAVFLLVGMGFCQDEGKVTREQWTQKVNEEWEKNKGASDIISMEGNGIIEISLFDQMQVLFIDIKDTGKGIPKSKYKTV